MGFRNRLLQPPQVCNRKVVYRTCDRGRRRTLPLSARKCFSTPIGHRSIHKQINTEQGGLPWRSHLEPHAAESD
jgi:hypothetical protein